MPSRDSNNATWFWLGYAGDFRSQPAVPYHPELPLVDASLLYDDARHVLELLPAAPDHELDLLPGVAIGVNGEKYIVETIGAQTRVSAVLCDETSRPVACDPFIFAGPRDLAIDRRGYLYVADARATRVVVLDPSSGAVVAVLGHPDLVEPVDVAVHPAGWIAVADRGGVDGSGKPLAGRIFLFDASLRFAAVFTPRDASGLPPLPRPRAVMVEDDGTLSVADGSHPRLLHFTLAGEPLADLPAPTPAEASTSPELPRVAGVASCNPCSPTDTGVVLATIHRNLRRRALSLASVYQTRGVAITRALDSGLPGTQWHRVEMHASVPPGTQLTVEVATAEDFEFFDPAAAAWSAPAQSDGTVISFLGAASDLDDPSDNQLVLALPGRFAWLRLTFSSDGTATPSLSAVRVLYPRFSYLDMLPGVFRQDPEAETFLQHFLALFELVLTGVEDRYELFSIFLDPAAAPLEVINWLACLVDLTFDPSWPLEKRRLLVASAVQLYKLRGTPEGLSRYLEIYTGERPVLEELFLNRPGAPAFLGRSGSILGAGWRLTSPSATTTPAESLFAAYAHRLRVNVYATDPCDQAAMAAVVDRIVSVNRPAHTVYTVNWIGANTTVGLDSRVGIDFVLGIREVPKFQLTDDSVLGSNTLTGLDQPNYVRPLGLQI